ncbi:MAG: beta-glucosidase [Steroidobacteraceae bacterium]|jgi:beta-glucosidase
MIVSGIRAAGLMSMILVSALARSADAPASQGWLDASLDPDTRAELALRAMTLYEKLTLVYGYYAAPRGARQYVPPPPARPASAGYIPGIARLGIPPQWESDAGIGVATQRGTNTLRERTALPSGLATAATWNPELAFRGGAMIGAEARASGFNVMLAGGVNLLRDPRNGRNFEYGGEDPLLAGTIVGAQVRGIQSNHIVSTVKHYALNDQETGRTVLSAEIDDAAARESDLLAFQFAIEQGQPGAVMCSYNRLHGVYACENRWLLSQVLKGDWHYPGYVMSDWGAVHSTIEAANAGLDQESAASIFDKMAYFDTPLLEATSSGEVAPARLDDMARRILRSLFAVGAVDHPVQEGPIDFAADALVSQADAEEAIVLLQNRGALLPLSGRFKRVAVIGAHADVGVLSGGGSAQVTPVGGNPVKGVGPLGFPGPVVYDPAAPLAAIAKRLPASAVRYAAGDDPQAAARLAADSDVAIVFAQQWTAEGQDASLTLPEGQDALIQAIVRANRHVIVVLETGGPVLMPWLDHVAGLLEAWYPGSAGGEAIARVLFGEVDASGRLPVTFPRSEAQLPRPQLDGVGLPRDQPFSVHYQEGAAVGYKWFDQNGLDPLFAFGFGLSYGRVTYSGLRATLRGEALEVQFNVRNVSARPVRDTPQVYVAAAAAHTGAVKRLAGWQKLALAPGASAHVRIDVDPRLLANWQAPCGWVIAPGRYRVVLAQSARLVRASAQVTVPAGLPGHCTNPSSAAVDTRAE